MRGLQARHVRPALYWASVLAALAALRLPYLTSPVYILDNDEAVVGIMARHIAEGRELPLYFAGQNYGLSVFETLPTAFAFKVFGDSAHVMALTMLALYLLGLLAYSRAFRHLAGSEAWGRALTIIFALVPGWVVWSMKARGLYVSGFLLTGCALAVLTRPTRSRGSMIAAGVLLGVIGLVQPLWLAATVPFLFLERRRLRDAAAACAVAAVVWLVPLALSSGDAYWQGPTVSGLNLRVHFIPTMLSRAFSGRVTPAEPDVAALFLGGVATAGFFVLMAAMATDAIRRRSRLALCVLAGMLLSLAHTVVLDVANPRYFLPSTVLLFVALAAWVGARKLPFRPAPLAAAAGTVAVMTFAAARLGRANLEPALAAVSAEDDLHTLITGLEADGVRGVYSPTGDIRWQILFYGHERIPARGRSATDRYPELPRAVEEARRSGEKTALVADIRQLRRAEPGLVGFPGYRVGERYVRLDDPNVLMLGLVGIDPAYDSSTGAASLPR